MIKKDFASSLPTKGRLTTLKRNISAVCLEIIVALLIALWIYTGLNKLIDYEETRFQMGRSPLIQSISGFLAVAVPISEVVIAGLLVYKKTRLMGLYTSLFLIILFTGYIYIMLHYSFYIPCSCGGVLAALSWENHLIFNIVFTILALFGIVLQSKKRYRVNS